MSDISNKRDWYSMSESAIIMELADFIKEKRLKKNYKQSELAEMAGIHRVTLSQFEHGIRSVSLITFIQLIRALNELEILNIFKIPTIISPLQMAKLEAKKRQRASPIRKSIRKKMRSQMIGKKIPFLSKRKK